MKIKYMIEYPTTGWDEVESEEFDEVIKYSMNDAEISGTIEN